MRPIAKRNKQKRLQIGERIFKIIFEEILYSRTAKINEDTKAVLISGCSTERITKLIANNYRRRKYN